MRLSRVGLRRELARPPWHGEPAPRPPRDLLVAAAVAASCYCERCGAALVLDGDPCRSCGAPRPSSTTTVIAPAAASGRASAFATPAPNRQIAAEVFLSVDAVKAHLRVLFDRFGLSELPQNEKRARLAAAVLTTGVLAPRDF